MAAVKKHITMRDARDRLIDLLGLGETYPLRDLPVEIERLTVPEGAGASIPVHASQRDCTYSLWERESETQATSAVVQGTGETILLESPTVSASTGYRIRATRNTTGRWVYLHELAEITIGLDTAITACVLSGAWLDEGAAAHAPSDARIVDHGTEVEVEIQATQLGVVYRLVRVVGGAQEVISQQDGIGNLRTLVLRTKSMTEDTVIRILAVSTTDPAKQELLDISLPVVIRPASQRSVAVLPSPIVDHQGIATVVVGDSQPGIRYQLHARPLGAIDLLPGGAASEPSPEGWMEVAGEDNRVFHARRPSSTPAWVDLPGFVALGVPAEGTGAALSIPTDPLADDCMIVVRAWREDTLSDGRTVTSAVRLQEEAIVLVRPDPAPPLHLQVLFRGGDTTTGALRVTGGQRGVFYHFRTSAGGADLGRPAYFYERHDADPEVNTGIGSLAVGTDLVVGRDPWTELAAPEFWTTEPPVMSNRPSGFTAVSALVRATTPPEPPIVDTPPLAIGTTLHGLAIKGRTGLTQALAHTAEIVNPPDSGSGEVMMSLDG